MGYRVQNQGHVSFLFCLAFNLLFLSLGFLRFESILALKPCSTPVLRQTRARIKWNILQSYRSLSSGAWEKRNTTSGSHSIEGRLRSTTRRPSKCCSESGRSVTNKYSLASGTIDRNPIDYTEYYNRIEGLSVCAYHKDNPIGGCC